MDLAEIKRQLQHLETYKDTALYHLNGEDFAYFRPADVADLITECERLTALCDGYRGEVEGLRQQNALYRSNVKAFGSAIWDENEAEWAGKVTRARAEGMEEAARIFERRIEDLRAANPNNHPDEEEEKWIAETAAALRARATKGESDEG